MTVNTNDLTNPVLQAVETWTTAQNHDLGYETQDRSSGKRYQYRLHDDGGASAKASLRAIPTRTQPSSIANVLRSASSMRVSPFNKRGSS